MYGMLLYLGGRTVTRVCMACYCIWEVEQSLVYVWHAIVSGRSNSHSCMYGMLLYLGGRTVTRVCLACVSGRSNSHSCMYGMLLYLGGRTVTRVCMACYCIWEVEQSLVYVWHAIVSGRSNSHSCMYGMLLYLGGRTVTRVCMACYCIWEVEQSLVYVWHAIVSGRSNSHLCMYRVYMAACSLFYVILSHTYPTNCIWSSVVQSHFVNCHSPLFVCFDYTLLTQVHFIGSAGEMYCIVHLLSRM